MPAKALRACLAAGGPVARRLGEAALERLQSLRHVGITERLAESTLSMAAALGLDLNGPAYSHAPSWSTTHDPPGHDLGARITVNLTVTHKDLRYIAAEREGPLAKKLAAGDEVPVRMPISEARGRLTPLAFRLRDAQKEKNELTRQKRRAMDRELRERRNPGSCAATPVAPAVCEAGAVAAELAVLEAEMETVISLINRQLRSLEAGGAVNYTAPGHGRAVQLIPDEALLVPHDLAKQYRLCTRKSSKHSSKDERPPHDMLITPDGRSFAFGRAARKRLPPAIARRIREMNALDEQLWKAGVKLLDAKLAQQREAGLLGDEGALKPRVAKEKTRVKGARKDVGRGKAVPGSNSGAADKAAPRDEL